MKEQEHTSNTASSTNELVVLRTVVLARSCAALVTLVTGIVYLSGGPQSPFLFLYLPIVMVPAMLGHRRVGLLLSLISGGMYSVVALALLEGWIAAFDPSTRVSTPVGGLPLQVIGLCSGMVLVVVLTNYLARKVAASYQLVEQSKRDFQQLSERQASLMDELPEGVITTALDGSITSMNHAAALLLGIDASRGTGTALADGLSAITDVAERTRFLNPDMGPSEATIQQPKNAGEINLTVRKRAVLDDSGARTGTVYLLHDVTKLRSAEQQLELQERMARLLADTKSELNCTTSSSNLGYFVGESPVMRKVFNLIERVAPSDATVLINGESGTGKELVARSLHLGSTRSAKPFVPVNCGAIPEALIESELFGHKKGAFTGADTDTIGLFRQADSGTIFLDEIGELPLALQAKLLRAIQERSVRPVGGTKDLPIDVRIIAATNRNLKQEITQGKFREDLYYRLNVIGINLPRLTERKGDIPLLVTSILHRLVESGVTPVVPPATMQLLSNYSYPGNVRELENILERAVVLGGEVILPEHLPDAMRHSGDSEHAAEERETTIIVDDSVAMPADLDQFLANIERRYLEVALVKAGGVKKKAAELLGMNFRSFRYRLQKFGMHGED